MVKQTDIESLLEILDISELDNKKEEINSFVIDFSTVISKRLDVFNYLLNKDNKAFYISTLAEICKVWVKNKQDEISLIFEYIRKAEKYLSIDTKMKINKQIMKEKNNLAIMPESYLSGCKTIVEMLNNCLDQKNKDNKND